MNNEVVTPSCQLCYENECISTCYSRSIKKRLLYLIVNHPGVSIVWMEIMEMIYRWK